jgi:endonuclease/exonuclease/phosphatase family metal-dependent hydrolase
VALTNPRTSRIGGRLRWAGLFGLIAVLSLALTPGVADAQKKKKKDAVKVLSYNLYLGSDLADATNAALASRTDLFADEVGEQLREVQLNDFNVRAQRISKQIKKKKVDLVGLQEAALWKLEFPTDGGGPPRGTFATTPLIDYIDTLLNKLNKKAKSKKQCGQIAKKRKAQGKKAKPCYRGYKLVVAQQEADIEQLGDFDNDPGPNNRTCDISSGTCGNPYPSGAGGDGSDDWISGNDDTGQNVLEPPAAECSDGTDNDGDGLVDWGTVPGTNETSGPSPLFAGNPPGGPWDCNTRLDDSESQSSTLAPPADLGSPLGLPQDTNMDNHIYATGLGGIGATLPDALGNRLDPAGVDDCARPADPLASPDTNPEPGPSVGDNPAPPLTPPWDAPNFDGERVPLCMFHGIDGDIRLQMRDVIIARKGAGVKTRNVTGGNFSPASTFKVTVFGGASLINFTRGWTAADVNVRGKKFRLVNTHLEEESFGTIREDQASELVAPGGPATAPKTVLIGDLNSDPAREPTNLPDGDGGSNIAINRLFAAGFFPVQVPGFSAGHGELLNDLSNTLDNGRIDHVLTNSPSIRLRGGVILDGQIGGLWASDHGGVLSTLKVPGGKKKK